MWAVGSRSECGPLREITNCGRRFASPWEQEATHSVNKLLLYAAAPAHQASYSPPPTLSPLLQHVDSQVWILLPSLILFHAPILFLSPQTLFLLTFSGTRSEPVTKERKSFFCASDRS